MKPFSQRLNYLFPLLALRLEDVLEDEEEAVVQQLEFEILLAQQERT